MALEIILGVAVFIIAVFVLVGVILGARSQLVNSGEVSIEINEDHDKAITTEAGGKLLNTLAENGSFLSSACGGGGSCAQCRCIVMEGGGEALPTEASAFTKGELKAGWRLACQVPVKQNMKIEVEPEFFGVKRWECDVVSN